MRNNPQEIIDRMLHNGEAMLAAGRADQAFETYMEIVRLCPDPTAQYNLGVLSAQGRGTEQSFLVAAYWFYQVSLDGDQEAGDRCRQCMVKYIVQHMNQDTPRALYERMAHFAFYVYRGQDIRTLANKELFSLGAYYYKQEDYAAAGKLFRAAAEFGDDGMSQNCLGRFYNRGTGVEKNDLTALYWFDRAVDRQIVPAMPDRDGILNAYRKNLSRAGFFEQMNLLGGYCAIGTEDIPRDAAKAAYWRRVAEAS